MKKGLKIIYKMQNVGRKMKKKKQILFDYVHKQILNITGILLKIVNITKKICVCAYKCIKDCIFRKNRALAPHERSAVPLGTDHCPVG